MADSGENFPSLVWYMQNLESRDNDIISGQFEATEPSLDVGGRYAEMSSLGREHPILKFLGGKLDRVTFNARVYSSHDELQEKVAGVVQTLTAWTRMDPNLGRPPRLSFWIGNGQGINLATCVMPNIKPLYDRPLPNGGIRGASMAIELVEYVSFDIGARTNRDTRYQAARVGDTYEQLARIEYDDPLLGVLLRQDHPDAVYPEPGDIIRLPARDGSIATRVPRMSSIAFRDLHLPEQNPAKQRLLQLQGPRSRDRNRFKA